MFQRVLKRVILSIALIGFGFVAFYLIRLTIFVVLWGNMLYDRDFMDASTKNGRGDIVSAETHFFGAPEHRVKTVISLKRADHWFSTTLVQSRSGEVLVGLKWRDDNRLDVQLDFGCYAHTSAPVTAVGPIHVAYHYGDPGHVPKIGYETFRRRDLPPEPCQ
jgi:hypothetical protein